MHQWSIYEASKQQFQCIIEPTGLHHDASIMVDGRSATAPPRPRSRPAPGLKRPGGGPHARESAQFVPSGGPKPRGGGGNLTFEQLMVGRCLESADDMRSKLVKSGGNVCIFS